MAEDKPTLNALVFDYLKSVSNKLAKQFKKDVGTEITELPAGSPSIPEMVAHFHQSGGAKRKLADSLSNGNTPAKKLKMNGKAATNGKAAKKGDSEDSEEDSSSDEEEKAPKKQAPPAKAAAKDESSDDADSEDENDTSSSE